MSELVRVYSCASVMEGEIVRGFLEAEGIPVLTRGEGQGPYRMGPVSIWVDASMEIPARMLLDAEIVAEGTDSVERTEER